jgi:hypothetical protein
MEMAASLSLAFLHVLEKPSPAERVVFLPREILRDVVYRCGVDSRCYRGQLPADGDAGQETDSRGALAFPCDREQHLGAMNRFVAVELSFRS